jgi:hypothetical protein
VKKLLNEYFISIDKESNKNDEINKIIHISIIMIFIAHATIADTLKDLLKHQKQSGSPLKDKEDDIEGNSQQSEIEKALSHSLP